MARVLDQNFMRANAPVKAMDSINGLLFIGGFFTSIAGVARFNLACINTVTRTLEPWNPVTAYSGPVEAIVCLNNVIYVGSTAPIVTGSGTRNYAAAFDLNGNLLPWNPNLNGPVTCMATDGTDLYLGGSFTTINGGTGRNRLAKVDAVNGTDQGWDPDMGGPVNVLTYRNGLIYAGGTFVTVNGGTGRNFSAALDPTTAVATAWNPNTNAPVAAIESDGVYVYIGGQFTTIDGGTPRAFMAATDLATGADQGIDYLDSSDNPAPVLHMRYESNTLRVGGFFGDILGETRVSYASINTPATLNAEAADFLTGILTSKEVNGSLFLGGFFEYYVPVGNKSRFFAAAKMSAAGGQVIPFPNVDFYSSSGSAQPSSVLFYNGVIYVGGNFTSVTGNNGTFARQGLVAFDPTGNVLAWAPTVGPIGRFVYSIVADGNDIYIGGTFNEVNGQPRIGVAKLDTAGTLDAGWVLDLTHSFGPGEGFSYALLLQAGSLYAGGSFESANGTARGSLVKADLVTGAVDLAWDPGLSATYLTMAQILGLATDGVNLYATGAFDRAGGGATTPSGVISVPLGGAGADNLWPVYLEPVSNPTTIGFCIAYYAGNIYIGGQFTQVQGLNGTFFNSGLVKADLAGNIDSALSWVNPSIAAIGISGGALFAFANGSNWDNGIQNLTLPPFQQLSLADAFIDLGFNANPNTVPAAMTFNGSIVYFVGQFQYVGLSVPLTEPQGDWYFAALLLEPDPPISIPRAPVIDFLIRKAL